MEKKISFKEWLFEDRKMVFNFAYGNLKLIIVVLQLIKCYSKNSTNE